MKERCAGGPEGCCRPAVPTGWSSIARTERSKRRSRTTDPVPGQYRFVATVNVGAASDGLIIDQRRILEAGSEITALQLLLKHLHLQGTVVSMDAAHAQSDTLDAIVNQGGDYLVSSIRETKIERACWK